MALLGKQKTETNTLVLIREWSMDGARGDLDGRFASVLDINAIVAERNEEPSIETAPHAPSPLMLKPAGEDDWRPLVDDVSNAA